MADVSGDFLFGIPCGDFDLVRLSVVLGLFRNTNPDNSDPTSGAIIYVSRAVTERGLC